MKENRFVCDECNKKGPTWIEGQEREELFPYSLGWIFIYKINGKVEQNEIHEKTDLHFCSKKCMCKYTDNLFIMSRKDRWRMVSY